MKNIEVLLREDVRDLGRVGDVVKVAAGYARNYLLPSQKAVAASADLVKAMAKRRAAIEAEEAARRAEFEGVLEALGNLTVSTTEKADEKGHLFGSVNAATIAVLLREAGHAIEEAQVRLEQPIKTTGTHLVPVHVHAELAAEVTVEVTPED